MGVCVYIAGGSVGGPTGVADADVAGNRVVGQQGFEPVDSAGGFDHGEFAAGRDGCHAGAVVAAVFQPVEPHEQEFGRITRSNVSNDPAHGFWLLSDRSGIEGGRGHSTKYSTPVKLGEGVRRLTISRSSVKLK